MELFQKLMDLKRQVFISLSNARYVMSDSCFFVLLWQNKQGLVYLFLLHIALEILVPKGSPSNNSSLITLSYISITFRLMCCALNYKWTRPNSCENGGLTNLMFSWCTSLLHTAGGDIETRTSIINEAWKKKKNSISSILYRHIHKVEEGISRSKLQKENVGRPS